MLPFLFLIESSLFLIHLLFEFFFIFVSVVSLDYWGLGEMPFLWMRESSSVSTCSHEYSRILKVSDAWVLRRNSWLWRIYIWDKNLLLGERWLSTVVSWVHLARGWTCSFKVIKIRWSWPWLDRIGLLEILLILKILDLPLFSTGAPV